TNDASFPVESNVLLSASVNSATGITNVEFFANGSRLSSGIEAPFQFNWQPDRPGIFSLTVVAKDEFGQSTTSAPVAVRIFVPEKVRPVIAVTSARVTGPTLELKGISRDNIGIQFVEARLN